MENCFKSFTKSLQEAHRLHAVFAPSTCCVLFYLSLAIRKRFYICLIKVLEDTLYLMFYEYKACIIHPPAAKKACFWVYLCGNKRAQWNYSQSIAAGGHSKHLWFFTLEWFLPSIYSPGNNLNNTKLGNHSKNCISKL